MGPIHIVHGWVVCLRDVTGQTKLGKHSYTQWVVGALQMVIVGVMKFANDGDMTRCVVAIRLPGSGVAQY